MDEIFTSRLAQGWMGSFFTKFRISYFVVNLYLLPDHFHHMGFTQVHLCKIVVSAFHKFLLWVHVSLLSFVYLLIHPNEYHYPCRKRALYYGIQILINTLWEPERSCQCHPRTVLPDGCYNWTPRAFRLGQ